MSHDVGPLEQFPDRQMSVVQVGRTEICIIRWSGAIYAIGNICSHQGGPLCRGVLAPRLMASSPGELLVDDAVPVIACAWHGWEFDVSTGQAIWDPTMHIRTFPVRVANGRVMVDGGVTE